MKKSSGIPCIIVNKVREEFNLQGKQVFYYCCISDKEVLGSCCSSQIHVPLWTQGIQSIMHSLDAQGLFHNPESRELFLTSSPSKAREIRQMHGGSMSVQGPALWPERNYNSIHPVWCWLWQQFTADTESSAHTEPPTEGGSVPKQPAQL